MRIHISLSKNREIVPFNYQETLVGKIHYWLGKNDIHDGISLYSISWLNDFIRIENKGFDFKNGSKFFFSSIDNTLIKKLIEGIQKDPYFGFGMEVKSIDLQNEPDFEKNHRFLVASPVFIKRTLADKKQKFYFYSDSETSALLTETLKNKLKKAGVNSEGVKVSFDNSYTKASSAKCIYKGTKNVGSICPIIVEGSAEQIAFAWNVGVGNSTGIGFGALI
jgi:CRISPR-associated endoribonuclease Cas6